MPENPLRPPRFPYVGALLCAACLGAAAWLPLRYWTVLDVTVPELSAPHPASHRRQRYLGRYVRVQIPFWYPNAMELPDPDGTVLLQIIWDDWPETNGRIRINLRIDRSGPSPETTSTHSVCSGRVTHYKDNLVLDTTASRFHPAGIAGLVVGAMGAFVFTVALRHWLGERRKFREEANLRSV